MKCPKCSGNLKYHEEVGGTYVTPLRDNGEWDDSFKDFYGESNSYIECVFCLYRPDFKMDGWTVVLNEPIFNIIAYFEGTEGEFITTLPLTEKSIRIIRDYNFNLNYIELDIEGFKNLQNYLNEEFDLLELNRFSKEIISWTVDDCRKFMLKNNIIEEE